MQRPPVRIGIGTPAQKKALREAGAELVWEWAEVDEILSDHLLRTAALRPGDEVILVQSNLLTIKQMQKIAATGVAFVIPGHRPYVLRNEREMRALRHLEPIGVTVERAENRGRKPIWPVPTPEQIKAILGWWHTKEIERAEVLRRTRELMGAEVPDWWPRDLAIKHTGTAARTLPPEAK